MTGRAFSLIGGAAAAVLLLCVAAPAVLLGGAGATACVPATATASSAGNSSGPVAGWDTEQIANAGTIITVGIKRGVPARGQVITLASAMQESRLRNLAGGDRDSIGLFQQRPSQGWGTPDQLRNTTYAAGKFYDTLLAIPGWQTMALTDAAQAVQRSAFPNAYSQWEDDATTLHQHLAAGLPACPPRQGWTMPVDGPVVSGYRTVDRPGHDGIDIAAPKGTTIHAAAAGVVTRIRCNASLNGVAYSCDRDGSPALKGCGWYLEVRHPGPITTRYCHLLNRPPVALGQQVTAGQPIGVVGTSGHSTGPHLHWEVHHGHPATEANAVDPLAYL